MLLVIFIFAQLPWLVFAQLCLHLVSTKRTADASRAQWSKLQLRFLYYNLHFTLTPSSDRMITIFKFKCMQCLIRNNLFTCFFNIASMAKKNVRRIVFYKLQLQIHQIENTTATYLKATQFLKLYAVRPYLLPYYLCNFSYRRNK